MHAHIHARQQHAIGVGQLGAYADLTGRGVHGQIGEQQLAFLGIGATIIRIHLDLGGIVSRLGQLAGVQRFTHAHDVRGRLRDVDVQRVDLLNDSQLGHLALAHQCTFGHQGAADAARDGGGHRGIAQVDAGVGDSCLARCNLCLSSFFVGDCHVIVLLADGVGFHQRLVAACGRGRLCQRCLCLCQCRLGAFQTGAVRRIVDLEQDLACLHVGAFLEGALLQDACNTSANLRNTEGLQTAWQIRHDGNAPELDGQHADFWWRGCALRGVLFLFLVATGCQNKRCSQGEGKGTGFHTLARGLRSFVSGLVCFIHGLHESPFGRCEMDGVNRGGFGGNCLWLVECYLQSPEKCSAIIHTCRNV
ncbi:hypothetical protein D3C72_1019420 [compost metagenome]